jgi:hypothetical protein
VILLIGAGPGRLYGQDNGCKRHPARVPLTGGDESWVGVGVLSEACLFILRGRYHLLLLIAIVLALTRRDLGVATGGGLAQCGP